MKSILAFTTIVFAIFSFLGYLLYLDAQSPTFTLKKGEWQCTKSHTVSDVQLIPQSNGQTILLPVISTVCDRYERIENVSQNDSTAG